MSTATPTAPDVLKQLRQQLAEQGEAAKPQAWQATQALQQAGADSEALSLLKLQLTECSAAQLEAQAGRDWAQAELPSQWPACAAQALQQWPDSARVARRVLQQAQLRLAPELHALAYAALARLTPDDAHLHAMAARIRHTLADHAGALHAAQQALALQPDDPDMLTLRLLVACEGQLQPEHWLAWADALAANPGLQNMGLNACHLAWSQRLSDFERMVRFQALARCSELPAPVRRHAEKLSANGLGGTEPLGEPAPADPGAAWTCHLPPDCRHVVFWFCGLAGVMPMQPLRSQLLARGVGVVFIKDLQRALFMDGVAGLGQGFDATAAALRGLLPASVRHISCAGSSAGGFAALAYGLALRARQVLLFGALTTMRQHDDLIDRRGLMIRRRLAQVAPEQVRDLAPALAQAQAQLSTRLQVHAWYGDAHHEDRLHARRIGHLPGVHLHPLAGYAAHDVLWELVAAGLLPQVLDTAWGPAQPAPAAGHAPDVLLP